jgi:hypothetical protein
MNEALKFIPFYYGGWGLGVTVNTLIDEQITIKLEGDIS